MHLPWTQIANEVLDHAAAELATALDWHEDPEIGEALALAGLVRFFRWARERCPNDRPPSTSSVLAGPHAARLIARQMRWTGDPEALIGALERVQPSPIVTLLPEGIRINGLDRYDAAWRKNYKDAAEVWDRHLAPHAPVEEPPGVTRPVSGRKANGARPVPDRQTQTQTQTQTQKNEPLAHTPVRARAEPPRADQPPLVDAMEALHQEKRGSPLDWGPPRRRMDREREVGDLAEKHGDAEVLRRLQNALTVPKGKFPYFGSMRDLSEHWGHYDAPFQATTGPPRTAHEVTGLRPAAAMSQAELDADAVETARWNEQWARAAEERRRAADGGTPSAGVAKAGGT